MEYQGVKYSVDMVLCIDATGSMIPVIENVKSNALKFHDDVKDALAKKGKHIDSLRIKVIIYRDFVADGDAAFKESKFFKFPDELDDFETLIKGIKADGGGPEPEDGLVALDVAIRSEWSQNEGKRRQVIVLWTDASCHTLDETAAAKPANYPAGIAKDLNELTDRWEGDDYVDFASKRLVLFAPDAYPWTDIENSWSNIVATTSKAGEGLKEYDYDQIIDVIAQSVQ
jgi:hypothetical protein